MKLSPKLFLLFFGVLLVGLFSCQSKSTPENEFVPESFETIVPQAEAPLDSSAIEERFVEIEEKLAERTGELRKVETELRNLEAQLDTLEVKVAAQNKKLSRDIRNMKLVNYIAWAIAVILLVIVVGGLLQLGRKSRK